MNKLLSTAALCGVVVHLGCARVASAQCAADNAGLTLPAGFCAVVVADSVGPARHLTVADNGDVFVAVTGRRTRAGDGTPGHVLVLRDSDGDGTADLRRTFAEGRSSDVRFHNGFLYYSTATDIVRYPWSQGDMEPSGGADTVVRGLPPQRGHWAKSMAFGANGSLHVNIGSLTNSCQVRERQSGVRGHDPCTELEGQAGIWVFDADRLGQVQDDGRRFATGLRNTVALAIRPQDGLLYGVMHGRDQLAQNWAGLFNEEQGAEKPAEEFVRIEEGDNFGWPYCYYDPESGLKVSAPEYGGDGSERGRCTDMKDPLIGFPGHWAPDGLLFYSGDQFPERFRGGAFVAFHGSWNRAPLPQGGYNIVFVPFSGDDPTGEWDVFARGFSTDPPTLAGPHRPVGLAEGPDGSLYISDDAGGRIYRILYTGVR